MVELTPLTSEFPGMSLAGDGDANWRVIEGCARAGDGSCAVAEWEQEMSAFPPR